jgi:hypothetical protein
MVGIRLGFEIHLKTRELEKNEQILVQDDLKRTKSLLQGSAPHSVVSQRWNVSRLYPANSADMDRLFIFNVQQFLQMALEQIELIKRKKAAYIDNSQCCCHLSQMSQT